MLIKLEELNTNAQVLYTITIVNVIAVFTLIIIKTLAYIAEEWIKNHNANIEKTAEKSKKSGKDGKKSSKSSKKSKSKKSKKGKSKKSKSKTSSSKSLKKSIEKKLPKLPSLKAATSEKKSEIVGGKMSGESAQKQPPSLTSTSVIKLQPQDPLLSLSNLKLSGEKAIPPTNSGQVEKEMKIMNNLEAEKLKALPLPPIITAAIDQKTPEATTPPLPPPKTTDSSTDAASASLKFAKQYPDATTPPQRTPQKLIEAEKPKQSSDGSDSSAPKDAALVLPVSSPPPPYSESVTQTTTWISSSSSNNAKPKREDAPSTI